jgi:hypothetical protein
VWRLTRLRAARGSFTKAQRPYLAMLTPEAPNPLSPPPRHPGWDAADDDERGEEEGDADDDDERDELPEVRVEPRGLSGRVAPVPVPRARMGKLAALRDGWLMYTVLGEAGGDGDGSAPYGGGAAAGADEEEEKGALVRYDLGRRKQTQLCEDVVEFAVSHDLQTMALLCDEDKTPTLRVFEAGQKAADHDDDDQDVDFDVSQAGDRASPAEQSSSAHLLLTHVCEPPVGDRSRARRAGSWTWRRAWRSTWTRGASGGRCSRRRGRRRCATPTRAPPPT